MGIKPTALIFAGLIATNMGLAAVNPILAPLVRELGLSPVQGGVIVTIAALMWSLTSPLWGRRSEVVGRKPVYLIGLFGFALGFTLFGASAYLGIAGLIAPLLAFVLMALSRGVAGSFFSAVPVSAQAYIADTTTGQERTAGLALIGAANGIGFIVGPTVSALLAGFGLLVPIIFTAVLPILVGLAVAWRLPNAPGRVAPGGYIPRLRLSDPRYAPMLLIGFLVVMSMVSLQVTAGFYFQDRLSLNTRETARLMGMAFGASGLANLVAQLGIVQRLRPAPLTMLRLGVPIALVGFIILLIAPSAPLMVAAFGLTGLGMGLTLPGYVSAISLSVGPDEQGAVAGLAAFAQGFGATVGPVSATFIYQIQPLLPYTIDAITLAIIALLVWLNPRIRAAASQGLRKGPSTV